MRFTVFPAFRIDHRNGVVLQMRRCDQGIAILLPGDSRSQTGPAGQIEIGDGLSDHQINHRTAIAAARGPQHIFKTRIEVEIVQKITGGDPAPGKGTRLTRWALIPVVVHEAV